MTTQRSVFFRVLVLAILSMALIAFAGCGGKTVQRIDTDSTIDLSGRWNDTDSRVVADEVIADVLAAPWLTRFEATHNNTRPTVIVGLVRNRSDEFVATETFTKDIERAYVNSGRVRVVASSAERESIRDERRDQADFSRPRPWPPSAASSAPTT